MSIFIQAILGFFINQKDFCIVSDYLEIQKVKIIYIGMPEFCGCLV